MYDIAISYAHEKKEYVEKVADFLIENGLKVFFDITESITIWGDDLYEKLKDIYNSSTYCVVFLSKEYIEKKWTNYEGNVILKRMYMDGNKNNTTVFPVRFDDELISRLPFSQECLNANDYTPFELAEIIIHKVHRNIQTIFTISDLFVYISKEINNYINKYENTNICLQYINDNLIEVSHCINNKKDFFVYFNKQKIKTSHLYVYFGTVRPLDLFDSCSAEFLYIDGILYCINYSFFFNNIGQCFEVSPQNIVDMTIDLMIKAGGRYWL